MGANIVVAVGFIVKASNKPDSKSFNNLATCSVDGCLPSYKQPRQILFSTCSEVIPLSSTSFSDDTAFCPACENSLKEKVAQVGL